MSCLALRMWNAYRRSRSCMAKVRRVLTVVLGSPGGAGSATDGGGGWSGAAATGTASPLRTRGMLRLVRSGVYLLMVRFRSWLAYLLASFKACFASFCSRALT